MNQPPLPPDDLPAAKATQLDRMLRRRLEESASQLFNQSCDPITQNWLSNCEWYFTTNAAALTLVINCPNLATNWYILNNIVTISSRLEQFSESAKIRVCPPIEQGTPLEIRVDEASVYRDSLEF